jgi:hypothetical protein
MSTLYNVVRDNIPTAPIDDKGLMDVARLIVGGGFPTGINRLRFLGFRYSALPAATALAVNTNEIAMILNVIGSVTFTINASSGSATSNYFGTVFNRIVSGTSGMSVQYALFTYQ